MKVTGELAGGAKLGGIEGGVGQRVEAVTDEAEWGVAGCRLVHTYGLLTWEETKVGEDHLGAKHDGEGGMWVDAAAQGASRERRKVGAHGDARTQHRKRALAKSCGPM